MNETKDSLTGVQAPSAPLFASSWVALFSFLRHSLGKDQDSADTTVTEVSQGVNAGAKHMNH